MTLICPGVEVRENLNVSLLLVPPTRRSPHVVRTTPPTGGTIGGAPVTFTKNGKPGIESGFSTPLVMNAVDGSSLPLNGLWLLNERNGRWKPGAYVWLGAETR